MQSHLPHILHQRQHEQQEHHQHEVTLHQPAHTEHSGWFGRVAEASSFAQFLLFVNGDFRTPLSRWRKNAGLELQNRTDGFGTEGNG